MARSSDARNGSIPTICLVGAAAAAVLIVVLDWVQGPLTPYLAMLVGPPLLAATYCTARQVALVGALSTALCLAWPFVQAAGLDLESSTRTVAVAAATGIGCLLASLRSREGKAVAELNRAAKEAQQAILRDIDPEIGQLRVAHRYISATAGAEIGGDLYEALETPYGVRLLIGDVRGKGLEAVRLASTVLGSFRHVAHERADLRAVVADLDRAVARSVGYEDFVTAAVVEERGGTLTVLNCGHPPPLLLRDGGVTPLDPPAPAPPLGFLPVARPRVERLQPGDRLLLYTDGIAEARRDGEFFPLAERSWRILGHGTVKDGLVSLENALKDWVRNLLDDDIALVLLEYAGAGSTGTSQPIPAWEWDAAVEE
ncbi:PP2C family protein-serine/threonine phosphatase [Fodinicola acaciae]|uniref:PP2C family protein-serine/threonine phosphatase n=1 Tax=Fodinicola acaciae TaxID=2681555 RepID=UPI0013D344A5|nr:PP2C family protein-serine/threonine phosphatase [Fodinicola acaciae]